MPLDRRVASVLSNVTAALYIRSYGVRAEINACDRTPCAANVTCTDVPAPGTGFVCGAYVLCFPACFLFVLIFAVQLPSWN